MSTSNTSTIAIVIPYYQKTQGLLLTTLRSIFAQTIAKQVHVIIVDDSSPHSAAEELAGTDEFPLTQITLLKQKNAGAGAARNKALEAVPEGTDFVAFLDSDDSWKANHLEVAVSSLEQSGLDAYFSDWWSFNFPDSTNFERIQTLKPEEHSKVDGFDNVYELGISPIDHILSDGGGVIQTSTVVYRYQKFTQLRFREEFFNGQDFFFWMDLGELGAEFIFSTQIGCDNGEGINIYQGSGWGTEHSLRRIRNEMFVWVSTEKFYNLAPRLFKANRSTIKNLQNGFVRDIFHRIIHRKPINKAQFLDIIKMTPSSLLLLVLLPFQILFEFFKSKLIKN
jgi:succinoglycan biosynthesis protein ExoW